MSEVRSQDADDDAMNDFFATMQPMQKEDLQAIMACYEDLRVGKESVRWGGRIRFDLAARLIILDLKHGNTKMTVTCTLEKFVKKLTGVAIGELWGDAGLTP